MEDRELASVLFETMRFSRLWPEENISHRYYVIRGVSIYCIFSIPLFVGIILHSYKMSVEHMPFIHRIGSYVIPLSSLSVFFMITAFIRNQKKFQKLFVNLDTFNISTKPDNFEAINDRINKLFNIYKWFMRVGVTVAMAKEYFFKDQCQEDHRNAGIEDICGLYLDVDYVFDITHFPVLELVVLYEYVLIMLAYDSGVAVGCTIFVCLELINVRVDHLKIMLCEAFRTQRRCDIVRGLKICVAYHNNIADLCKQLNECFYLICLPLMFQFAINIGLPAFYFLLTQDTKALVLCIGWIIALGFGCLCGQRLINKSYEIASVLYDLSWYECDTTLARDVLLVLIRSQKPLRFYAGPFYVLSFQTMREILTGAYSCVALLYGTTRK